MAAVATRASATLTIVSIFLLGTALHLQGLATIGEIVTFMNFAGMLIGRLEQVVGFVNWVFLIIPKLQDFFQVLDTQPAITGATNGYPVGTTLSGVCNGAPGCVNPGAYSLGTSGQGSTNGGYYDVLGRRYFLGFKAKF